MINFDKSGLCRNLFMSLYFSILACVIFSLSVVTSGAKNPENLLLPKSNAVFVKNTGQWDADILSVANIGNNKILFKAKEISFIQYRTISNQVQSLHWKLLFSNSTYTNSSFLASSVSEVKYNYISSKRFNIASSYESITYQNIYQNIDLKYYIYDNKMKYDYVVHKNGHIEDIQLTAEGIEGLEVVEEQLNIKTKWGIIKEQKPYAYQMINGNKHEIPIRFQLINKNTYGFKVSGNYDPGISLIIDPALEWSTFVGGTGINDGRITDVFVDKLGFIYATGYYNSTFPTTPGVFQQTDSGAYDAFVFKLTPDGASLVFATYLGGTNDDRASGIAVNASGQIFITGRTASANFPVTASVQNLFGGGGLDAFVSKLSPDGQNLLYSTFLGGGGIDEGLGIILHNDTSAIVTGTTTGGFPISNAIDGTHSGGGNKDIFISKLNRTASVLLFSTYYGKTAEDIPWSIKASRKLDRFFVAGATSISFVDTFPTTPGSYQRAYAGGSYDGFVVSINMNGDTLFYATLLGGNAWDEIRDIDVNANNTLLVTGFSSSSNLNTGTNVFQDSMKGVQDAFVSLIDSSGANLLFTTYLGGAQTDRAYSISTNLFGDFFISGTTESPDFPTQSPQQPLFGGKADLFVSHFNRTGKLLLYSTFFGGDSTEDYISNIHFNPAGNEVVVASSSASPNFYTTSGVIQENKNNNWGIGQPVVFKFVCPPFTSVFTGDTSELCFGDSLVLDADTTGDAYIWNTGDTTQTILVKNQFLYIVGIRKNGDCTYADSMFLKVNPLPNIIAQPNMDTIICAGDSIQLNAFSVDSIGYAYTWNPTTGFLDSADAPSPRLIPPFSNTYYLTAIDSVSLCQNIDSVHVNVIPDAIIFPGDTSICELDSIQLFALGGTNFAWTPPTGLSDIGIQDPTASPSTTITYRMIASSPYCPTDTAFITITVNSLPVPTVTSDTTVVIGEPVQLSAQGGVNYSWLPIDDLSNPNISQPVSKPIADIIYIVTVIDSNGCSATDSIAITVENKNNHFVPGMFSPNGDGINDVLFINQYGFKTVDFRIYNRWGKLLFSTTDRDIGWDGTFNNKLQDMDNYLFYLSGEAFDGTQIDEKGVIVLVK